MGDAVGEGEAANPRLAALDALAASHARIFDAVDSLRDSGLERELIPKLVVIGDQKSGKSSVLEAIARIPFPVDKKLCTRFPTELILRRSDEHLITVSIQPSSSDGSDGLHDRLRGFHRRLAIDDEAGLVSTMREASNLILGGSSDSTLLRRFSDDTLRILVSGPGRYPLTLVDLPGLFESETREQNLEDKRYVQKMVRSFITEPRNALLLVISATTPRANLLAPAEITRSGADKYGRRTLGIVSKVDNPDSVDDVMSLFQGEGEWKLRHGWHCLKNRTPEERRDNIDRDEAEAIYFRSNWNEIPSDLKGIDLLRPRLGKLLAEQISRHLPALITDVRREMKSVGARLSKLSIQRTTEQSQRNYLSQMAVRFEHLACDAVNGRYGNGMPHQLKAFFSRKKDDDSEHRDQDKRLQAVVRAMTQIFHAVMVLKGKSTEVEEPEEGSDFFSLVEGSDSEDEAQDPSEGGEGRKREGKVRDKTKGEAEKGDGKAKVQDSHYRRLFAKERRLKAQIRTAGMILRDSVRIQYDTFPLPIIKSYEDFEDEVMELAARFRGTESLQEVNPELLSELMRAETSHWQEISMSHLRLVWDAVMRFVDLALEYCVDASVLPDLRQFIVHERLEKLRQKVEARLTELLNCHDGVNPAFHDMFKAFDLTLDPPRRGASFTAGGVSKTLMSRVYAGISGKQMEQICEEASGSKDSPPDREKLAQRLSEHLNGVLSLDNIAHDVQNEVEGLYQRDMERMAVRRTIDTLKEYYFICLFNFSANVSALVIQNGLLNRVPFEIFTHDIVAEQDADTIATIAGEKESDARNRVDLERRFKTLKAALAVFETHNRNMV